MGLAQPLLQLRGTTAALERQRSLKRCRHLLDAWRSQRLQTLEQCIAQLLQQEDHERSEPAALEPSVAAAHSPVGLDMESRIAVMFAELNGDALRFQELYYNERKHIGHLDRQRCAGLEEVLRQAS